MGKSTFSQNSFNFGEISPRALGRYDAEKPIWKLGVAKLENFLNYKLGGASFWPGLRYIANTKNTDQKIRLETIAYSAAQAYVLEFGDLYIRFFSNVGGVPGQVVVNPSPPVDVYTVLLSHFDGANGQVSYDAETGQSFSFFGAARLDTSQFKFGPSSIRLDPGGESGNYLTLPNASTWDLGAAASVRWVCIQQGPRRFVRQGRVRLHVAPGELPARLLEGHPDQRGA